MRIKKHIIHGTYLVTGIVFIVIGLFTGSEVSFAAQSGDVILDIRKIFLLVALAYLIFGATAYLLYRYGKTMSKLSFWVHYLITTLGLLAIGFFTRLSILSGPVTYTDYDIHNEQQVVESYFEYSSWVGNLLLAVVLVQLLFLSNLVRTIIKPRKSEETEINPSN